MDVNNIIIKDCDPIRHVEDTPPIADIQKPTEVTVKKKRRRGKTKRKIIKPFLKVPWQDRRKNDNANRINRYRKLVMAKSRAPFNNNQFLMEIHKPEPENNFDIPQTPSARTRDSSFSIDSEDNYFYSLPEDEEEYLTKEFSSVYEDAQCERLSNMSKTELIQEYLLLEAKYDNLVKRTERSKPKLDDDEQCTSETEKDMSITDKESMITDRDTSGTSNESSITYHTEANVIEMVQRLKEQEEQINELKLSNEKLQHENEHLRKTTHSSSSEDSESDSSSSSDSCSSSSQTASPANTLDAGDPEITSNEANEVQNNLQNGTVEETETENPLVNGFHSPNEQNN